jgi:putative endonuclease
MNGWYFYIISNANRTLYAGIASNLVARFEEHRRGAYPNGFTARYNFDRLVYFECLRSQREAAMREKQVKGWRRSRKLELVGRMNPDWRDLSADWGTLLGLK